MRNVNLFTLTFMVIAAPVLSHASTVYFLNTNQSGGNTTIDQNHADLWKATDPSATCPVGSCVTTTIAGFDATYNWLFGGGTFTIKQNNSNAPITLTLYDGATSVDTVTVSAASVSNSYTATNFDFSTPYQIVSGHKYYVTLTSSAAVNGDHQYDIKEPGSAQLADAKGSPLAPVSNAPEPGTWGMMAGGFALCVIGTRKRKPTA